MRCRTVLSPHYPGIQALYLSDHITAVNLPKGVLLLAVCLKCRHWIRHSLKNIMIEYNCAFLFDALS